MWGPSEFLPAQTTTRRSGQYEKPVCPDGGLLSRIQASMPNVRPTILDPTPLQQSRNLVIINVGYCVPLPNGDFINCVSQVPA